MLLVILGAGASADSVQPDAAIPGQAQGWRPPLADELFAPRFHDTLMNQAGAVVLAERVRTSVARGETLEHALARLQADASDRLRAGQVLELQYYLQQLLWDCGMHWNTVEAGMSNYLTLVSELEEWRAKADQKIVYATFNYDTLLEASLLKRFRWNFAKTEDYVRSDFAVIKLHGSANWFQVTGYAGGEGDIAKWRLIDAAADLVRTDEFIVGGPGTIQYGPFAVVPAIAVPAEPKAAFVCPQQHLEALKQALPKVDHILCVGWRGVDRNLVELMKGRLQAGVGATVVTQLPGNGAPDIQDAKHQWPAWVGEAGVAGGCRVIRAGFSGFVRGFLPAFIASLGSETRGKQS